MLENPKKSVAFICIGNACRSQMAEGFARQLAGDGWEVFSAGSRPAGFVAPLSVQVMAEIGIDISKQFSKGVDYLPKQEFDVVITMGCGDECPYLRAKERLDWALPDPIGESPDFFREVRDEIGDRVKKLMS